MFRSVLTAVAMVFLLVACAKTPVEDTVDVTAVTLHFNTAEDVNPGGTGQPAPVRVRIFELKNAVSFERADYFGLAERAQATLGADLIDQDEVLLHPGQQLTLVRHLNDGTRKIGLAVGFREIDQAQWRALLDVRQHAISEFLIDLDTHAVHSALTQTTRSDP